jgi:ubiquinone/menaquinone biosynthesis C-methylase UbiE
VEGKGPAVSGNEGGLERLARVTHSSYEQGASHYKELWAPLIRGFGRELIGAMAIGDAVTILDLGTGVGSLLSDIQSEAKSAVVVGADRVPGMIVHAPREFPLVITDASCLPFGDSTFDATVLAFILFHLEDPIQGLREAGRVLRPGGRVGITTWGNESLSRADDIWAEELDRHGAEAGPAGLAQHKLMDTPTKVRQLFDEAGLESVEVWTHSWEHQPDPDVFLRLRTNVGQSNRKLDTLTPQARGEALASITARLSGLPPEDFRQTADVIFATGRR